jgi:pimeloyl-ACP methyl ester carboxylesterase
MRTLSPLAASARGPHRVGVVSLELDDPHGRGRTLPVDVWYPAAEDAPAGEPADHPFAQPHAAERDLPPIEGPCPVALFSHGNSGLRRQSTFLTTHLASWGAIVAAPDHTGNTTFEMFSVTDPEELKRIHLDSRRDRPRDLTSVLDAVAAGSKRWPAADTGRVAACGHSFGGWTAFKMPRSDPRVRAVCGLAPAAERFVGRKAFLPGELPLPESVAALIIAGLGDVKVELDATVLPLYERLSDPRCLVGLEGADHYHFCDGIELLHTMHEGRDDPRQTEPTLPYAELLAEESAQRVVCGLVTAFLSAFFAGEKDPTAGLTAAALAELDANSVHLLAPADSDAARQRVNV